MEKCVYCKTMCKYGVKIDDKFVCDNCKQILDSEEAEIFDEANDSIISPVKIKEQLDKFVVKQEDAKIMLAIEAYNHMKRCNVKELSTVEKNNILLVGPSGCGKTYLVETLAKIIDVPFVSVNATEFTAAGYVGKNVSSIGQYLIDSANGDIKQAEKGIVFIDEVDKLAGTSMGGKDVGGTEVQKELLKIIEGEELHVQDEDEFFGSLDGGIVINTKNILFIFSGAFESLREKTSSIGFGKKQETSFDITPEKLIKNGFLKEFIGRIPLISEIEELTVEDLVDILTKTENNLIYQYKKMFAYDNIELEFTNEAIYEIAKIAKEKNIGARGCKSILGKLMNQILFKEYSNKISKLIINEEIVRNGLLKNDKKKNNIV